MKEEKSQQPSFWVTVLIVIGCALGGILVFYYISKRKSQAHKPIQAPIKNIPLTPLQRIQNRNCRNCGAPVVNTKWTSGCEYCGTQY